MSQIRKIYDDLPEQLLVPVEFAHRRVEVVMISLDDVHRPRAWLPDFFAKTAGQWQGLPIQRGAQPEQESRGDLR